MTPEQQQALEFVVDRQLTPDEITAIDTHLDFNARNDVAIAEILSVGRTKLQTYNIGTGDVLDTIGLTAGNSLLDEVYNNPNYRYVPKELDRGNLDISRASVRAVLDQIAANPLVLNFDQVHSDMLKALAEVPDPIDFNKVSNALNVAEGRMTWNP